MLWQEKMASEKKSNLVNLLLVLFVCTLAKTDGQSPNRRFQGRYSPLNLGNRGIKRSVEYRCTTESHLHFPLS